MARMLESQTSKPIGKNEVKTLIASLEKPRDERTDSDLLIIMLLFKESMLMKKHKLKGKELLEVVKRLQLQTKPAGALLMEEGKPPEGFSIIVEGTCSKHVGLKGRFGKAIREKIFRSTTKAFNSDACPRFRRHKKIERIDSMDYNADSIKFNIGNVIESAPKETVKNKTQPTSGLKIFHARTQK